MAEYHAVDPLKELSLLMNNAPMPDFLQNKPDLVVKLRLIDKVLSSPRKGGNLLTVGFCVYCWDQFGVTMKSQMIKSYVIYLIGILTNLMQIHIPQLLNLQISVWSIGQKIPHVLNAIPVATARSFYEMSTACVGANAYNLSKKSNCRMAPV